MQKSFSADITCIDILSVVWIVTIFPSFLLVFSLFVDFPEIESHVTFQKKFIFFWSWHFFIFIFVCYTFKWDDIFYYLFLLNNPVKYFHFHSFLSKLLIFLTSSEKNLPVFVLCVITLNTYLFSLYYFL